MNEKERAALLEALGLMTAEDRANRITALFDRYIATAHKKEAE